jgi:hypothetical protein
MSPALLATGRLLPQGFRRIARAPLPAFPYAAAVRLGAGFHVQARLLPQWFMRRVMPVPTGDVAFTLLGISAHIPWGKKLFVRKGDWGSSIVPYKGHESMWQIFVEGIPYQQTEQYREMRRHVDAGIRHRNWPGCRTPQDVDQYFQDLFMAHDQIRVRGYRSQAELGSGKPHDEVGINVGPDGELIVIRGGTHRLALAHILGVPTMPVLVFGVHQDWAKRRYHRHGPPLDRALSLGLDEIAVRNGADAGNASPALPASEHDVR